MEFVDNHGQPASQFPFDCSQFYLQQQTSESHQDTEQELIVSGRNSVTDIQTPQNSSQRRFILFQKQPSSLDGSLDNSKESALKQIRGNEILASRQTRKLSVIPAMSFSEESKESVGLHRRSKTRQITLGGTQHS